MGLDSEAAVLDSGIRGAISIGVMSPMDTIPIMAIHPIDVLL